MRDLLIKFLDALEAIGGDHEELYDTDVRERVGEVIERLLVTPSGSIDVPRDLGMFSEEGNRLVAGALERYLAEAVPRADELQLDEAARRVAVWDGDAVSRTGSTVDEFLGWID